MISVVIPTRNRVNVLGDAIRSVLEQDWGGSTFEIVVVDDGSSDGTETLVRSFNGVRYVRTSQGSAAGSRNVGIQETTGEWIAFLDDDDVWRPSKVARSIEVIRNHPEADIVFTDAWICDAQLQPVALWTGPRLVGRNVRDAFLLDAIPSTSGVMVRRTVFEVVGLFDVTLPRAEDRDMWLRAIATGRRFVGVPEPLVLYRVNTLQTDARKIVVSYRDTLVAVRRYFRSSDARQLGWRTRLRALMKLRGWYADQLLRAADQLDPRSGWRLRFTALGASPIHCAAYAARRLRPA
jgi:glycosyltransferase involved in cell wall biosynthesis